MIKAIGRWVIAERDPVGEVKEGGVIIPAASQKTPRFGHSGMATVISVGRDVECIRPGDRICLKHVAGDDILQDGKTYVRLREKEIIGLCS